MSSATAFLHSYGSFGAAAARMQVMGDSIDTGSHRYHANVLLGLVAMLLVVATTPVVVLLMPREGGGGGQGGGGWLAVPAWAQDRALEAIILAGDASGNA